MKVIKRRNRQMTMERILRAMGEVMAERGTRKAGINAVAERAGINKVLIYRYFGGWNGLLEAYVQRGHYMPMFSEKYAESVPAELPADDHNKLWSEYVISIMNEFRTRKSAQELTRWEMTHGETDVAQKLVAFRNDTYQKVLAKIAPNTDVDSAAVTALLVSGATFLSLVGEHQGSVIDVDLKSDEGWARLNKAVERILAGLDATK
jgi:AcrR family transcriptional regulator